MKGIYILVIKISKNIEVEVGSLGKIKFGKGIYAYVGSAQNNLEKRVERHLRKNNKKARWHIDYLLANKFARVIKVLYKKAGKEEECKIAKKLGKSEIPIPKFGCSDCSCNSHFFKVKSLKNIRKLGMNKL